MKLIIAVIRPTKLRAVHEELARIGVERLTISDAQEFASSEERVFISRGGATGATVFRKINLEIAVNEDYVERTIDAIEKAAKTGKLGNDGDGKVFVMPLVEAIQFSPEKARQRSDLRNEVSDRMIVHVTSGLMATSALSATARQSGVEVKLAMNDRKLMKLLDEGPVKLIVVDLQTRGLNIRELVSQVREKIADVQMIAYAQHVHEDLLDEAQQLDFNAVITRGQFTRELPAIVASVQS